MRLYVAGQTARSIAAVANLKRICDEHLGGRHIPTLVRRLPLPVKKVIGDLSNVDRVLACLDIMSVAEH